jgi:hypothetical protein
MFGIQNKDELASEIEALEAFRPSNNAPSAPLPEGMTFERLMAIADKAAEKTFEKSHPQTRDESAWIHAHLIYLSDLGLAAGYISEEKAALILKKSTQAIAGNFSNWSTFLDSFQMALTVYDAQGGEADPKALVDGVRLVRTLLSGALERHGLAEIQAQGLPFDPARHEAVAVEPTSEVPEGHVVRVLQPGYLLGEHVVRQLVGTVLKDNQDDGKKLRHWFEVVVKSRAQRDPQWRRAFTVRREVDR